MEWDIESGYHFYFNTGIGNIVQSLWWIALITMIEWSNRLGCIHKCEKEYRSDLTNDGNCHCVWNRCDNVVWSEYFFFSRSYIYAPTQFTCHCLIPMQCWWYNDNIHINSPLSHSLDSFFFSFTLHAMWHSHYKYVYPMYSVNNSPVPIFHSKIYF